MATYRSLQHYLDDILDFAFDNAGLASIARTVIGPKVEKDILAHAQQGNYLGGNYANKGYSEATLPAFFFGDLQKSGGSWKIQSSKFNTTVNPNSSQLIWRHAGKDPSKATAFLIGGYAEFRRLAGRSTSFVNLTFTGRMLSSVSYKVRTKPNGVEISVGAGSGEQDKAYYTDKQREWLGLTALEELSARKTVSRELNKRVTKFPNASIR